MAIKAELRPHFKFDNSMPTAVGDIRRHVTCNEAITPEFLTTLKDKRAGEPGGVGLTIGSGGAISLLPHLRLDGLIFVDVNPAVLGFSKFLIDCIANAQSPDHAREMIIHDLPRELHEVEDKERAEDEKVPTLNAIVANKLAAEKRYFGSTHWSDPEAFPRVQEALDQTTFAYANRSIVSQSFYAELAKVLGQTEQELTYVNFSNVHHWLTSTRNFRDLARLTSSDPTIQYSVHPAEGGPNTNLEAKIADSLVHYVDLTTREIRIMGGKAATGRSMPRWSSQS